MNINRFRNNLAMNKQTAKTNMKTSSVAIGSNIVNSFDAKCQIAKENLPISQQNVKKKRTALENISNANNTNSSSVSFNKDAAKKSRFGNPTFGLNQFGNDGAMKKATESVAKKSSILLGSRELLLSKQNLKAATSLAVKKADQLRQKPMVIKKPTHGKENETDHGKKPVGDSSTIISQLNPLDEQLIESIEKITKGDSSVSIHTEHQGLVSKWEDIDADDKDEFTASEYATSIFNYYREREKKFAVDDYMTRQPHLNKQMRLLLVDWMVEVQQQLEFNHEVLYLSVKLLDLFLNSRIIEKEKLQLLGGAAMFVACKFEERMPPIIDDFIFVSDNAYDRSELIKMEIEILKTVGFDIGAALSYTFLRRYSKCVKADMRFLTLSRYILELSLQDYNFAYVSDSLKACAALYLALKMASAYDRNTKLHAIINKDMDTQPHQIVSIANLSSTEWNSTLVHYTGSFLKDFIEYVPSMNNLLIAAVGCKYKTIYKKYSHQVFYEVAKIPPLNESELESLVKNHSAVDAQILKE